MASTRLGTVITIGKCLRLSQRGEEVTVTILNNGREWLSSPLAQSYYGRMIFCPDKFEDEAQANYYLEAADAFICLEREINAHACGARP